MKNHHDTIPGSAGLMFFGEAFSLLTGKQKFFYERYKRYGNVAYTKVFNEDYVILYDEQLFVKMLDDNRNTLSSRIGWSFLQPLLGNGILMQDGFDHLRSRKLISASLRGIEIQNIIDNISRNTYIYINDEFNGENEKCLYRSLKKFTFYTISSMVFGQICFDEVQLLEQKFFELLSGQTALLRFNFPYSRYATAIKAKKFLQNYIYQKINNFDNSNKQTINFLNSIIYNNKSLNCDKLNDHELVDQVFQILFGGYETVALVLSWMLYILSIMPDEKKKILNEISDNIDINNMRYDNLNKLYYIDKFILETIRLFPPVYIIPRGLHKAIIVDNYFIEESSKIIFCPIMAQRNENIFNSSLSFNPIRFNDIELRKKILSFGYGVHKCLGEELAKLEIKIFLSIFLKKCNHTIEPNVLFSAALNNSTDLLKHFKLQVQTQ